MKCEWHRIVDYVSCGEIEIRTGPFGTQLRASDYVASGTPVINVRNIGYGTINEEKLEYINEQTATRLSMHLLRTNDIVFGRKGAVDRHAFITEKYNGWLQGSDCIRLRVNTKKLLPQYLSYYFLTQRHKGFMESMCSHGSTMASLNQKILEKIEFPYVSIENQLKIVEVLSAIDRKVLINRNINANLQQQAQAIFKSWFVDFEPWGGEKPSTWIDAPLGTFIEIKRGGSPRPIKDFLTDDGLRWLKISDVTSLNSPFVLDIKEHIKKEGLRKTVYLNVGELVLSNSATPGIPKILDVDSCIHDGWLYFPKSQFSKYWLYLFFLYIRKSLVALGNGSVFTNLKTDILKAYMVTKPTEDTLAKFDEIVTPIFTAMLNYDRQNEKLASLRDSLLPKLMSGDINIEGVTD